MVSALVDDDSGVWELSRIEERGSFPVAIDLTARVRGTYRWQECGGLRLVQGGLVLVCESWELPGRKNLV